MKNPCPGLWLADIQEQTKHLTSLTNNLITLSRMEEERTRLQMIDFPFSDVVEETVQSFQALARTQNKTFETLIQPMISLYGDEKSLTQLVSILLDNAMKYSTPKGEISLRLEKAGNNVKLSVYNTADSINREQLPHLFDRFYRTDKSRSSRTGGYGLGLSIAAAVVNTHKGKITGMGIPKGITLIVGGGYHGKSTLLNALELGVYNHIPGDGREYVITDATAVKLRSEDGRFIKDVDISMFINDLPNKKDTRCFSTLDASGSTSQAAGIAESIEAGSHLFLLDEDTSATNFMVRDAFMQQVIQREKEPITPFLERAEDLYKKAGISTILVAGSSGAFFHIADTIIQMDNYVPKDITASVKKLCSQYPLPAVSVTDFQLPHSHRIMSRPAESSKHLRHNSRGNHSDSGAAKPERLKTRISGTDGFSLGRQEIDLRYTEQLIDAEQTAALGLLLKYAVEHLADGRRTLPEIVQFLWKNLSLHGLSFFTENQKISCGYATPRIQEIYACLNRYRGL